MGKLRRVGKLGVNSLPCHALMPPVLAGQSTQPPADGDRNH
jgi:hypothetical protein